MFLASMDASVKSVMREVPRGLLDLLAIAALDLP